MLEAEAPGMHYKVEPCNEKREIKEFFVILNHRIVANPRLIAKVL